MVQVIRRKTEPTPGKRTAKVLGALGQGLLRLDLLLLLQEATQARTYQQLAKMTIHLHSHGPPNSLQDVPHWN